MMNAIQWAGRALIGDVSPMVRSWMSGAYFAVALALLAKGQHVAGAFLLLCSFLGAQICWKHARQDRKNHDERR